MWAAVEFEAEYWVIYRKLLAVMDKTRDTYPRVRNSD